MYESEILIKILKKKKKNIFHGILFLYVCVLPQHQEKRGDIVASLRLLVESVKVVRAPGQPGCAASLLPRLENNINNYLLILTHLQLSVRGSHCGKLHANKHRRTPSSKHLFWWFVDQKKCTCPR